MGAARNCHVPRNDAGPRSWQVLALLALAAGGAGLCAAQGYPSPPASPSPGGIGDAVPLFLELVVNGRAAPGLTAVLQQGPHFQIESETLRRLHIRNHRPAGEAVAVDALPGVQVEYDSLAQRLLVQIPADWLPTQLVDASAREPLPLSGSRGLLLNYDLYSLRTQGHTTSSVWSELRYFGPEGLVSSTGIYRQGSRAGQTRADIGGQGDGYVRYDTHWTRTDPQTATQTAYGDLVTGALPWSTSVRLGGVQWSRNFGMRPDLVTYPLPMFSGQAAVPSAVDVFINGFRAASQPVEPGPFTFAGLPTVNGAGTASVVTTDALGRQVVTAVPFYVSTSLLRPGWTDYSVSLGALRQAYGQRSFAYGRALASGVLRRGLSDQVTAEAQAQLGEGLDVLGLGGVWQLGTWGVANASAAHGRVQGQGSGWQYSLGWQYSTTRGGIVVQQMQRTPGYGDAGTYAGDGFSLARRTRQVDARLNLGRGAWNLGWLEQIDALGQRNRLVYGGYTLALGSRSFVSLTAGRTLDTHQAQVRLQWTYLLGPQTSAQLSLGRQGDGTQGQISAQSNTPRDEGWGWNLGHSFGGASQQYSQGTAQYRDRRFTLQGGVYDQQGQASQFAGVAGSLGWMDGYRFASNRISDGFALVSTQGEAGVPVLFNHQVVGRTDERGYALVTEVPAYYQGRYAIDPLALPADVHTPALERQAAVARGMGTLIELPVVRMRAATLTLVDPQGQPLPAGTPVVHVEGDPTVVGWDGMVYLSQVQASNHLVAHLGTGQVCHAAFALEAEQAAQGLRLVCGPEELPTPTPVAVPMPMPPVEVQR